MKTKTLKKDSINIITLGCSKNMVDSEVLAGQLLANKKTVMHESTEESHAIVIVNTCGFIDKAKEESIQTILEQIENKKQGKVDKVFVTGCLSERYKESLAKEIPEVDAWFGTFDLPDLVAKCNANYKKDLIGERKLSTPKHYAYIKISEGCNRTCAFCAIPLMRGKHISKPMETIVDEVKKLVSNGVKEIMLIAQELTYYGLDIYKKRSLPSLLHHLADIEGLHWIRLHYAYPTHFPIEIIEVMKVRKNICPYLDMPLQHASDAMLQAMRRQITQAEINDLINRIRDILPHICLRTTLITGFPGETNKDIDTLLQFLSLHQFDRVGVFQYSHEENTSAYSLVDNISAKEKQNRAEKIMAWQQEISYQKNIQKIGQIWEVLIDKKEANRYIGRTYCDSVEVDNEVIVHSHQPLVVGSFVPVKITEAYDYDIEGTVVCY